MGVNAENAEKNAILNTNGMTVNVRNAVNLAMSIIRGKKKATVTKYAIHAKRR